MNTVTGLYLSKINEVQAKMAAYAARAGVQTPTFSGLLSSAAAEATAPVSSAGSVNANADYDSIIRSAAAEHGLDPNLVRAVIQAESSFRPNAVSHAGAQGLMQLMPSTAKSLGVTDSFDPEQNIRGGTKYLSGLIKRFGDVRLALAAYNTGPGRISRLEISDADNAAEYAKISERVRGYVSKVISSYEAYQSH